ncbi:hypothetical protein GCM10020255_087610 [Rhodococcus baikonurensis]
MPGRRLRIPTRHETKTTTLTSSARRTADDDNDFSTVLTTYIRLTYSQFDNHRRRPGYPDAGSPKTPAETYRPESYARDVETKAPTVPWLSMQTNRMLRRQMANVDLPSALEAV